MDNFGATWKIQNPYPVEFELGVLDRVPRNEENNHLFYSSRFEELENLLLSFPGNEE